MHVFATANGLAGGQWYLWPAVLALMIIAVLGMRRSEWRTAKGGLAIAARGRLSGLSDCARQRLGRNAGEGSICVDRILVGRLAGVVGRTLAAFANADRHIRVGLPGIQLGFNGAERRRIQPGGGRLSVHSGGYSAGIDHHSFALSYSRSTRALRISRYWARSAISSGCLRGGSIGLP